MGTAQARTSGPTRGHKDRRGASTEHDLYLISASTEARPRPQPTVENGQF